MSATSWEIDGVALDTGGASPIKVLVKPKTLGAQENIRAQSQELLHATQRRHILGRNLPVYRFRFEFYGASPARYERMHEVRNMMRLVGAFTLTAPDNSDIYFEGAEKDLDLSLDSLRIVYEEGVSMVALEVSAVQPNPDDFTDLAQRGLFGCHLFTGIQAVIMDTPIIGGDGADESFGLVDAALNVVGDSVLITTDFVQFNDDIVGLYTETVTHPEGEVVEDEAPASESVVEDQELDAFSDEVGTTGVGSESNDIDNT